MFEQYPILAGRIIPPARNHRFCPVRITEGIATMRTLFTCSPNWELRKGAWERLTAFYALSDILYQVCDASGTAYKCIIELITQWLDDPTSMVRRSTGTNFG